MRYLYLLGRILFSLIFISAAPRHFTSEGIQHAVKYLWTSRALCLRPAVGAEAGPREEQVLNLTSRPWQGPTRSFFCFGAFPELEMREPTSPVWCGGASRSSFALRNDPIPSSSFSCW